MTIRLRGLAALCCAALSLAVLTLPASAADVTFGFGNGLQKKFKDMGDGTYAEQLYLGGGTVAGPAPSAITSGQAKVAVTNTAVCLSAAALVNGLVIKALAANAAAITIGGTGVNSTTDGTGNGYVLAPGEAMSFAVDNASRVCINGASGAGVSYAGN